MCLASDDTAGHSFHVMHCDARRKHTQHCDEGTHAIMGVFVTVLQALFCVTMPDVMFPTGLGRAVLGTH